jgi:hypothetical protein
MSCKDCERYKLSASMWRNEAYKHAGTPLPWEPEELLRKEYERGYADAMGWKVQNHLEHLPPQPWTDLTKEECFVLCEKHKDAPFSLLAAVQDKLKEKNHDSR